MRAGGTWVAYAAAAWALVFAFFHIVWACGWYVGLDAEEARNAFRRPSMLAYDLLVAAMCLVGALLAVAPVKRWGASLMRPAARVIAWIGAGLLVLRAAAGAVQVLYFLFTGRVTLQGIGQTWEPWFSLGGVLFGLNTLRHWRRLPP